MGFFKRLVAGLTKTRDNIISGIDSIFSGFSKIDDDFYEELEEILIMADLGMPEFAVKKRWILTAVLLPSLVKGSYLLAFSGQYVLSNMSGTQIFNT